MVHGHRSRFAQVSVTLLVTLALAPLAGCASADGSDAVATESASLASTTKTFVVPVDARARELCRAEMNRHYCDAASAQRAAKRCIAKVSAQGATSASDPCASPDAEARGSCVRFETMSETCVSADEVYPDAASCETPRYKSCAFYSACLEPSQACGPEGYALGFGEKYCYAFKNASFTLKGQAWRDSVMLCLQQDLVPKLSLPEPLACAAITDFAFGTHPACYTKQGASICFLPPGDLATVFGVIGLNEALKGRTLAQMKSVVGTCVGQLTRRILFGERAAATLAPRSFDAAAADEASGDEASGDELRASYAFWKEKAEAYGVLDVEP